MTIELSGENGLVVLDAEKVGEAQTMMAPLLERAKAIQVVDEATFREATEAVVQCKRAARWVEENFGDARKAAHEAWKAITKAITRLTEPIEGAATTFSRKANGWREAENRRIEAEARKAEEAARKKADEEKLAIAADLDANGLHDAADRVLEEPTIVAPPVVREVPKVEGATFKENWTWELTDKVALVKAIAEGKLSADLLEVARGPMTALVKATKGKVVIAGVRVFNAGSISVAR